MFEEDKLIKYFEKNYHENVDMSEFRLNKGLGCIINGPAGSGKTQIHQTIIKGELHP